MHAHSATRGDVERTMRPHRSASSAVRQCGSPSGETHRTQQIRVEYQLGRPHVLRKGTQRADGQLMQALRGGVFFAGQTLGGFEDCAAGGVPAVIGNDVPAERVHRVHLSDDVEVASGIEQDVDVRKRLQPCAELGLGAAHPLGHRTDDAVLPGQQRDDAIGLTQLVLAQDDCVVTVWPHALQCPTWASTKIVPALTVSRYCAHVDFHRSTLVAQAAELASRRVTSVEVVTAALDRIERSQPTLNAFRIVRRDAALTEAAEADRLIAAGSSAPLLGVPIAVKDDVDIVGEPTAFGCAGRFPLATEDSEVVRRLRAAGAIIVGKTNSPELGQWPFTGGSFGHTRNPWHRDRTPGGSSGGSSAAVAAELVSAALGSDGAGSVRIPASWTNLVGIKPQRGRISTWPDAEAFNGITVIGPLARTVADAALLLDVVSGGHDGDLHRPTPLTVSDAVGRDPGSLRIALSLRKPFIPTPAALDPEITAAAYEMAAVLRLLDHRVVVDDPAYGMLLGLNFLPRSLAGVAAWLDRLPDPSLADPRTRANARSGRALAGAPLRAARAAEPRIARRIGQFFDDYDIVLAPTTATPPPRVDAIDGISNADTDRVITEHCPYTWPWNVLGWPSVNVPAGLTKAGLPIGLQLMGHESTEPLLVSVAAQLENVLQWHRRRPEPWWNRVSDTS